MATLTKAQLRGRVSDKLGQTYNGESIPAEVASMIDNKIDDLTASLKTMGLAYWTADAIPQDIVEPLSRYVAAHLVGELAPPQGVAVAIGSANAALQDLTALLAPEVNAAPTRSVYF